MLLSCGDAVVVAKATEQERISPISTNVEYIALAEAVKTVGWLRKFLSEVIFKQKTIKFSRMTSVAWIGRLAVPAGILKRTSKSKSNTNLCCRWRKMSR